MNQRRRLGCSCEKSHPLGARAKVMRIGAEARFCEAK
jgi:hypothetical protein